VQRKCAFCPAEAVEQGGEHVWDDWINKALPHTHYFARKRYSLESPIIEYNADRLNEKLPVVCRRCNNGWMSKLSLKVKDRFSRTMLDGDPFSLGISDAAILAAFTFMKAVVVDHNSPDDYERFFTTAARERFGTSLILPPLLKLWFAAYRGKARMSTRANLSIVSTGTPSPIRGMEFLSFSYLIGQLTLQLLAPRWKDIENRGKPLLSLNPNVQWEEAATPFWPHNGTTLPWPPPKIFADETIQLFIDRFNNPVNL